MNFIVIGMVDDVMTHVVHIHPCSLRYDAYTVDTVLTKVCSSVVMLVFLFVSGHT